MNELCKVETAADLIKAVCNRYEIENPKPDARPLDRACVAWYRGLLLSIGNQCKELDLKNVNDLDALFRRVYVPLSIRYGITPKINDFCLMIGTDYPVIDRLFNSTNNQSYKNIYNSWLLICRESLISDMVDNYTSNINHIFIAKSIYGLTDKPNTDGSTAKTVIKQDRQSIIAELTAGIVENPGNVENLANNVSDNSL